MEFAIASLLHHDLLRVVASAAAQDRATVQTGRVLAAHSPMGSCPLELLIGAAPVGTLVQVHQIRGSRHLVPGIVHL